MEQEKAFPRRMRKLREKIADLTACLAGDHSSERWQKTNTELQRDKVTLRALTAKEENAIPEETRAYDKREARGLPPRNELI
jgi:hypothetical protein